MNKALFLDRDGVVNEEINYLYKIEDFKFIDGIFDLCKYYQSLGYLIIIVTNQSGIARNYYSVDDFNKLTIWMNEKFLENGISLSHVYYCPHHPEISALCSCRKPKPGMLLQAAQEFNINLSDSILIGDKERDIEAGINAGLNETYLFIEDGDLPQSKATKIVNKLECIWKKTC
jgi:D-glycero-D-manno-heptose 1,7-bisphosphate phosphatase